MAKLPRFTQKLFASLASSNQLSQFGSYAAGSPVEYSGSTVTPTLIQNLSNFLTGWYGAVIGNNAALLQDMNSICYLFAYQISYLFQSGIPEWDAGTTYYTGSLVNSAGTIYASITDTNLGNALSDITNWKIQVQVGDGLFSLINAYRNVTVPSGESLFWPNGIVGAGKTYEIQSGARFSGITSLTVNGTFTVDSGGIGRII